jgi:hypothetical protein
VRGETGGENQELPDAENSSRTLSGLKSQNEKSVAENSSREISGQKRAVAGPRIDRAGRKQTSHPHSYAKAMDQHDP